MGGRGEERNGSYLSVFLYGQRVALSAAFDGGVSLEEFEGETSFAEHQSTGHTGDSSADNAEMRMESLAFHASRLML